MAIWEYRDVAKEPHLFWSKEYCPFCKTELRELPEDWIFTAPKSGNITSVAVCAVCGWPRVVQLHIEFDSYGDYHTEYRAAGSLKELDVRDIRTPLFEVREILAARYSERFNIHPRKFEEVVGSVFESLGYEVAVTNYRGDEGIDIILEGQEGFSGIQVKRHKNRIEAEQIRSLAGALVLGGFIKGLFITTSNFRSGAEITAARYKSRGISIELMNSKRFLDVLKIAQRKEYSSKRKLDVSKLLDNLTVFREWTIWADGSSEPGIGL